MNTFKAATNRIHQPAALAGMVALALALACCVSMAFAAPAFANKQLNAPTTVSDDITRLHVNKLDADTHEYVQGATMAIINEATGEVVDSWVTGSGVHENEKGLDVDVVYILRELAAPEGYGTVEDVRFVVNATEGTGITILSQGADSELTESYKVSLYDKKLSSENEIVVTRETPATPLSKTANTSSETKKAVAPQTGDETPLTTIAVLVGVGILFIGLFQLLKRRLREND